MRIKVNRNNIGYNDAYGSRLYRVSLLEEVYPKKSLRLKFSTTVSFPQGEKSLDAELTPRNTGSKWEHCTLRIASFFLETSINCLTCHQFCTRKKYSPFAEILALMKGMEWRRFMGESWGYLEPTLRCWYGSNLELWMMRSVKVYRGPC